jgi:hypothetical protein
MNIKNILFIILLGVAGMGYYYKGNINSSDLEEGVISPEVPKEEVEVFPEEELLPSETIEENYTCSGKVYCSEMTSCEEALFYQRNCPNTKMDGDRDGIPCESQWCGHLR